MIELKVILLLLATHFLADFILQSNYHAQNKSSSNFVLLEHVTVYMIPFAFLSFVLPITIYWLLLQPIAHFITDWCTSRITKRLWAAKEVHWFFVVIGLDQLLHYAFLFTTYAWLVS